MAIRLITRALLAAVCVAGIVAAVEARRAQTQLTDSLERFAKTGDNPRALRELRESDSSLHPSAYRETAVAFALLATDKPVEAEEVIAEAARREPDNPKPWLELTRIQLARGREAQARESWAHVRRLDPLLPAELPAPVGG